MKYKVGDKVRIKTWEEMEKKYGLYSGGSIKCGFTKEMEKYINRNFSNRILEITEVIRGYYKIENTCWSWTEDMIKEEKVVYDPIYSRFEILDIRKD